MSVLNGGILKLDGKVLDLFYELYLFEKNVVIRKDKYIYEIIGLNDFVV